MLHFRECQISEEIWDILYVVNRNLHYSIKACGIFSLTVMANICHLDFFLSERNEIQSF